MATKSGRTILSTRKTSFGAMLMRRESILVLLFIAVNILGTLLSKNYWKIDSMFTNVNDFLINAFVALPMAYILLMGDIDISVGSNVCLSATILGIVYNATGSIVLGIVAAVVTGTVCGAINGLLVTKFTELAPMILTLSTQIIFRGVSEIILGDKATGGMQKVEWFKNVFHGRLGSVPYLFFVFAVLAVIFGIVMHKTVFGRRMYAIGANKEAARYSGIKVQKTRFIVFTLTGLMCGIASVFYCAKMGTVKSDIAAGYDMESICMCVLGGISTDGGKGNFPGLVIAILTMIMLRYALGLKNVNSEIINIIIGALLVIVVVMPELKRLFTRKKKAA